MSSANNRAIPVNASEISFMYIQNSIGPRTDPCGTPAEIYSDEERELFIETV